MSIEALVELSRYYGANKDYVIAGGGNSSFKTADTLYVKGSGTALAEAVPETFVKMDRGALARIWNKTYPASSAEREKEVLADLLAARKPGEEQKRPSVETMLHDLLPFKYVMHLHPALVNGLSCSRQGETAMKELFGNEALWVPSTNPGYVLSLEVKIALDKFTTKNNRPAAIIILQNHGVFVGAEDPDGINEIYRRIMESLEAKVKTSPDFSGKTTSVPSEYIRVLNELNNAYINFINNKAISNHVKNLFSFYPVSSAFTPDHIIYSGSDPLFIEKISKEEVKAQWKKHIEKTGRLPKIMAVKELGVFGLGVTEKAAALAVELFMDSVRIACYSESFGGPLFMDREKIDFINNWEVEVFRTKVSTK